MHVCAMSWNVVGIVLSEVGGTARFSLGGVCALNLMIIFTDLSHGGESNLFLL